MALKIMRFDKDRRASERTPVVWNALMLSPSHQEIGIVDLSSGGAAITMQNKIPVGAECEIMADKTNPLTGRTIRALLKCKSRDVVPVRDSDFRVSVVFVDLEEGEKNNLDQLLQIAKQETFQ